MKKFSIKELAEIIEAEPVKNTGVITDVSIDSRTTKQGDCFFAIKGDNFDGADFINEAFAKGAVCAVVNSRHKTQDTRRKTINNGILNVNNTIEALGLFAKEYRRQCKFKVVAITGSVGKTMTRQIVYHILSKHFKCCQSPKNFNNNIGLPLTLLGAKPEVQIVIAELGSNRKGEIAYLTNIAEPNIAVVTNVHPAHLAGFGDLQTVKDEKLSIAEGLKENGILIINADIKTHATSRIITFGKSANCEIQAENVTFNGFESRFTIDGTEVVLPLAGSGNIENALAAWAICKELGIKTDDFAKEIKTFSGVPMRTEPMQIGTLTVLNDCYNANPASMKNALKILGNPGSGQNRRSVFICGDMAELGRQTKTLHAELGKAIAAAKIQLLLTVGKLSKITAETAKQSAGYNLQTKCFEDTISACNELKEFIKDYDVILVKGSRTAKLEMTVEKLKELFS